MIYAFEPEKSLSQMAKCLIIVLSHNFISW